MPKVKPVMAWGVVDRHGKLLTHMIRRTRNEIYSHWTSQTVRVRISVVQPKRKMGKK